MPMLTPIRAAGANSNGFETRERIRRATDTASSSPTFGSRTTNSSPPRRHAKSTLRTLARRRSATATRTASPVACPNPSLTALKPSRSRQNTTSFERRDAASGAGADEQIGKQLLIHGPIGKAGEQIMMRHLTIAVLGAVEVEQDPVILQQEEDHADGVEWRLQADQKQERDRRHHRRDGKGQRQDANQERAVTRRAGVARGNAADEIGDADAGHQDQRQVARPHALKAAAEISMIEASPAQIGAMVVPACRTAFAFATSFIIRWILMLPRTSSAATQA